MTEDEYVWRKAVGTLLQDEPAPEDHSFLTPWDCSWCHPVWYWTAAVLGGVLLGLLILALL